MFFRLLKETGKHSASERRLFRGDARIGDVLCGEEQEREGQEVWRMRVVSNGVVRKHFAEAVLGEVMEQIPWIRGGRGHQCKGPEAGAVLVWWRTSKEAGVARWMI